MKSLYRLITESQLEEDVDGQSCNVVFVDENDKILLLLRPEDDELFPGTWCTPGGHRQYNESPSTAARREAQEECGIDSDPIYMFTHTWPNGKDKTNFYIARFNKDFFDKTVTLSDEHDAYEWVSENELSKINLSGQLLPVLERIYNEFV